MSGENRPGRSVARGIVATLSLVLLLATPALGEGRAGPIKIYVSPQGDDSGPGTERQPYATLGRAQQRVRALTATMRTDVVVNLRAGTHVLDAPLELSAAAGDSGRNGHRVIYQAHGYGTAAQEPVVISGGRVITGWREVGGVWSADVGVLETRQLYVNGKRAMRASRGTGLPGKLRATKSGYRTSSTAPQSWTNPADIELVYTGGRSKGTWPYAEGRCGVAGISGNSSSTTIAMDQPCYALARSLYSAAGIGYLGRPTDVENSMSFLRKPGTFYLDRSAPERHVISYLPRPGEDMRSADVVAPVLETLISGKGTKSDPLHDVSFRGLTFAHATWLRPSGSGGFPSAWSLYLTSGAAGTSTVPGNVVFHSVRRIRLEGNRFTHLGAQALEISKGSSRNVVAGNVIEDVSDGGIVLGAVSPDAKSVNRGNRIANNWIHDIGVEYRAASGIWTELTQDTTVAHNQIDHVPYAGILSGHESDARGVARRNRIVANRVFDTMRVSDDGGGIYIRGEQGPSLRAGALIRANAVYGGRRGQGARFNLGIYTDDTTNRVTVRGNVVYGYLASIGGCSDPFVRNVRFVGNFWDPAVPYWVERPLRRPGVWPCGDPKRTLFARNERLTHADPGRACRRNRDCAAILRHAGLRPAYRHLLDGR